ncbi:glycosyltransferase family 2 protein [Erwinia sorbitola]|uniref:Glycosyltransferase n=1 Tax=Erwinia sorbitola TaxID=2681984 RepID=A0A6I6ER88_9GAMM|nr:glycosyltransferase family 2 protein [Erwinia sorbitola]QGU89271.1 glycosyltransferase [Erwinia sorbitola]
MSLITNQSSISQGKVLSILVTAHNLEDYITDCMESILLAVGDLLPLCEIILLDDSSVDRTPSMMMAFANKNKNSSYFRINLKKIGQVRNYGLSLCSARYITMIDGDDIVCKNSLKEIVTLLVKENPDLYICKLKEYQDAASTQVNYSLSRAQKTSSHKAIKTFLTHKKFQAHLGGKVISRKLFTELRFPDYTCYEDAATFPEILMNARSIYVDENSFYFHRKRNGSLSNTITAEKISYLAAAVIKMDSLFGEKYRIYTSCHVIELLNKHYDKISLSQLQILKGILKKSSKMRFIFNPFIRFSFKKKYIKLLSKNKY